MVEVTNDRGREDKNQDPEIMDDVEEKIEASGDGAADDMEDAGAADDSGDDETDEDAENGEEDIEELLEDTAAEEVEADVKPDREDGAKAAKAEKSGSEEPEADKKRMFRKKPKKDKKDEKIEELSDRLMRNLAEFENFRNRTEKEKSAMFEIGAKSVIEKMLPIMDNLERGFDGLPDGDRDNPFVKGIEAVYKQMQKVFEELGVTVIDAMGNEFDPNLHNAVMHEEDDSEESNKVTEVFQKGYLYKDSVIRHSMVKVLN